MNSKAALKREIRELRKTSSVKQIALKFGLSVATVNHHLGERSRAGFGKSPSKKLIEVKEGFFNEHERENWLI